MIQNLKGAFLKSRKHRVPLEIRAHHDGAIQVSQVVLQATADLKPGRTYQLWLQGKNKAWRPTRWIDDSKKRVQWRVGTSATKVTWTAPPTASDGHYTEFGCGSAINQAVKLPMTSRSGVVKVELSGPKASQTYWVPMPVEGPLQLGHGMCSGPFDVQSAGEYSASLTPIDSAGVQGQVHQINFSAVSAPSPRVYLLKP